MIRRPILLLLFCAGLALAETKPNIAVMDLAGSGFSPSDLVTLSNRLRTELFDTKVYTVVERSEMETILKEQGFQQTGCTDAACAVEAGQLLNVDFMILGSIDRISRVFSINLRAVSVKDGAVVKNAKADLVDVSVEELMLQGLRKSARLLAGLDTVETASTPTQLRGRKIIRYKNYKGGEAGSLNITVRPGDSQVFLDDSLYGAGSMIIDYVPVGIHTIRMTRKECRKLREEAEVYANQETALNYEMKPAIYSTLSLGGYAFKKNIIRQTLIFAYPNTNTGETISLDFDYNSGYLLAPSFTWGWESGRNYFGGSMFGFPLLHEKRFVNVPGDTFNLRTRKLVLGGFFDYWRMSILVPDIFAMGFGVSAGFVYRENSINPIWISPVGDSSRHNRDEDKMIGKEDMLFGGPTLTARIGYKYLFLVATGRLNFGRERDNTDAALPSNVSGQFSTIDVSGLYDSPYQFVLDPSLEVLLQVRF